MAIATVEVDAEQAIADLKKFKATALPFGVRNGLNRAAFLARAEWQAEIRQSFTLRNAYTERSVLVTRVSGNNVATMQSVTGSAAPYMGDQEAGGTVRGQHGRKGIPGPVAAGLAPGAKRTKAVRAGYRLGALSVAKTPAGASRKQRNAVALSMAVRSGAKAVLLERPKGGKAIFKLMGGRRKPKVKLLWDFTRASVHVPAEPTLHRTIRHIGPRIEGIYAESIVEQLKRHRILGY